MTNGVTIDIAFSTRAVRSLCQSSEAIERKYGAEVARALISRLADVRASSSIAELSSVVPLSTDGEKGNVTIQVSGEIVSYIHASENHRISPRLADGNVDWARVTRVQIRKVEVRK